LDYVVVSVEQLRERKLFGAFYVRNQEGSSAILLCNIYRNTEIDLRTANAISAVVRLFKRIVELRETLECFQYRSSHDMRIGNFPTGNSDVLIDQPPILVQEL